MKIHALIETLNSQSTADWKQRENQKATNSSNLISNWKQRRDQSGRPDASSRLSVASGAAKGAIGTGLIAGGGLAAAGTGTYLAYKHVKNNDMQAQAQSAINNNALDIAKANAEEARRKAPPTQEQLAALKKPPLAPVQPNAQSDVQHSPVPISSHIGDQSGVDHLKGLGNAVHQGLQDMGGPLSLGVGAGLGYLATRRRGA